jgi:hypothetical protein
VSGYRRNDFFNPRRMWSAIGIAIRDDISACSPPAHVARISDSFSIIENDLCIAAGDLGRAVRRVPVDDYYFARMRLSAQAFEARAYESLFIFGADDCRNLRFLHSNK